jgi:hypothetical protein
MFVFAQSFLIFGVNRFVLCPSTHPGYVTARSFYEQRLVIHAKGFTDFLTFSELREVICSPGSITSRWHKNILTGAL